MKHNTFHLCKNGRQQPGSREECPYCTPAVKKINAVIVKQAQQIAELKAALQALVDYHATDYDDIPEVTRAQMLLAKPVTEKAEES
jgi:hypothetical protein